MPTPIPTSSPPRHERRYVAGIEVRELLSGATGLPTLAGYAAKFGPLSEDLGGFRETIRPGAFAKTLTTFDQRALAHHDLGKVLGRRSAGTLRLVEDSVGLAAEIDPPDTSVARDTVESVRRKDLDGMSFGFLVIEDDWQCLDGVYVRELIEVELIEVSVVAFPAYTDATVALRSLDDFRRGPSAGSPADSPGGSPADPSAAVPPRRPVAVRSAVLASIRLAELGA